MPRCAFSANFSMYDVTPVENLFIEEYMRKAPGDFVKVYLYALKLCYHPRERDMDLERMARALELEPDTVQSALTYWTRQGILALLGDGGEERYEFLNLKSVLFNGTGAAPQDALYRYRDFNQRLQKRFGNRLLKPQDFETAYDWIEVLKLPEDVVVLLCEHCIEKKGERVSFAYIDKVAQGWAKGDIRTLKAAREEVTVAASRDSDAARVLRRMGIRRAPTPDEGQLYGKWVKRWGFDLQAVLVACGQLTRIQSPNFAYLDRVLEGYMQKNLLRAPDIEAYESQHSDQSTAVREALRELGAREQSPAPEHIDMYRMWTLEWGIEHEAIIEACRQCARRGRRSFDEVDHLLSRWHDKGIRTGAQARELLQAARELTGRAAAVLEQAGVTRKPTAADLNFLQHWTQQEGFEYELLLDAAKRSASAESPLKYLEGILRSMSARGVRTLEEARAQDMVREQSTAQPGSKPQKRVDAQNIAQRSYEDGQINDLFDEL